MGKECLSFFILKGIRGTANQARNIRRKGLNTSESHPRGSQAFPAGKTDLGS